MEGFIRMPKRLSFKLSIIYLINTVVGTFEKKLIFSEKNDGKKSFETGATEKCAKLFKKRSDLLQNLLY